MLSISPRNAYGSFWWAKLYTFLALSSDNKNEGLNIQKWSQDTPLHY